MTSAETGSDALARRLRDLRERHWQDRRLTQRQLADALAGDGSLSVPLISSWESVDKPVTPPDRRLEAYARFFATRRSLDGDRPHLVELSELTPEERELRDELLADLRQLRDPGMPVTARGGRIKLAAPGDEIGGGTWFFADQRPVTIVCARLPETLLTKMPYTDPDDPDFVKLYSYADLDSLVELHGHIRAVNPASRVNVRNAKELAADDLTTHLVLLGGVDWNVLTRDVSRATHVPVRQQARHGEGGAYEAFFEVGDGDERREFAPRLDRGTNGVTLREDVCHFFRGVNPFNVKRTVTICNGMFGRGTYGAVRALTDSRFRDRNESFLAERFRGSHTLSIVSRVLVVEGETVTPDWTIAENRLHEWPDDVL